MTTSNTVAKFEALEAAGVKPNTVAKFEAILEAAGVKLAPLCGNISSLEAGAMQSVSTNTGKLAATYAVMWGAGIRPSDYITPKSKGSTATPSNGRIVMRLRLCYATLRQSWPSSRRQWPKMQP
jgi:hypothetical protein